MTFQLVSRNLSARLLSVRVVAALLLIMVVSGAVIPSGMVLAQTQRSWFQTDTSGSFDYYVLSLSWSPSYCSLKGDKRGSAQCITGRHIGFTVHGLWPQFVSGYPSHCSEGQKLVQSGTIDSVRDLFPDEGLARYQWRKHGSCTGSDPVRYFNNVRTAVNKVRIPDRLHNVTQSMTMQRIDIERGFTLANPGLRPEMMRVMCHRGQLEEVRICMDKTLRDFVDCGRLARSDCGFSDIHIEQPS